MIRRLVGIVGLGLLASQALAAEPVDIGIGYLGQAGIRSKLSLVEQPAENDGIAGARLAIEDNNTTGKFLNQRFALEEIRVRDGEDVAKPSTALADRNGFIIGDPSADRLLNAALRPDLLIAKPVPSEDGSGRRVLNFDIVLARG